MLKWIAAVILILVIAVVTLLYGTGKGWLGSHEGPGTITNQVVSPTIIAGRTSVGSTSDPSSTAKRPKR